MAFDHSDPGCLWIWVIAAMTIGCVLVRPWNLPEALWASGGAILLVLFRLLSLPAAWEAMRKGLDVYLFLTGMMLLAELARREGVFDWCASLAVQASRGSRTRLFFLVYAVGVIVTVFLSNDATAVVMTPAVFAATKRAKIPPLPCLFACALVANAASFVLPISNPANLVLFRGHLPSLGNWLRAFTLPSVFSVGVTCALLYLTQRRELAGKVEECDSPTELSATGKLTLAGLGMATVALLVSSALGRDLGVPSLAAALIALTLVMLKDWKAWSEAPRNVSWSVLPMVAGLFVVVAAVNKAGALEASERAITALGHLPAWAADLSGAFGITLVSNLINNLPSGLITGTALEHTPQVPESLRNALLVGVDLGPNLSVTGSLATLLWLIALRREGQDVSAWSFLKIGVLVLPGALALAVLALRF